jgi:hypothetical protein
MHGDQGGISGLGVAKALDEIKTGAEMASSSPSSWSRRERASVTTLVAPDLYSTEKSKPRSLPTQWCCGMVARR